MSAAVTVIFCWFVRVCDVLSIVLLLQLKSAKTSMNNPMTKIRIVIFYLLQLVSS